LTRGRPAREGNMLTRVVSGGQSGVDLAALDAAKELGIATGGWLPRGMLTEDGPRPEYAELYGMLEMETKSYPDRTKANVRDSDATLIVVRTKPLTGGTKLTRDTAGNFGKLWLAVDIDHPEAKGWTKTVRDWIDFNKILTLNVAGPRESKLPGIYADAKAFLLEVLRPR
jgi:hypothetical protein